MVQRACRNNRFERRVHTAPHQSRAITNTDTICWEEIRMESRQILVDVVTAATRRVPAAAYGQCCGTARLPRGSDQ